MENSEKRETDISGMSAATVHEDKAKLADALVTSDREIIIAEFYGSLQVSHGNT